MTAVEAGTHLPAVEYTVTRADLVRYAGASGDFNPIHWSDRFATAVGLPGVIAHGMYTMALAGRAVTEWVGDPAAMIDYRVRFTKQVPVPDDGTGARIVVSGVVTKVGTDGTAKVEITAQCGDDKVLGQARALIRLPQR